jgi:AcrR family transcriptional regulator
LLSTKGYEATSPSEIQKTSGVGQGSFYHHFATKADLAAAALQTLAARMCADFDQLANQVGADQIAAYLSLERDSLAGCRIGRITMESSISDKRIREPIGAYFEHLRKQLAAAFEQLDNGIDSVAMADLAIATVQGGFVLSRATGDSKAMRNATSALATLISIASSRN